MATPDIARRLALEVFTTTAGPALVKQVAEILSPRGIPVMPLKGVLLQRLVYREVTFRPLSDVDLLVPDERFVEAVDLLRDHGFTRERWEPGGWEVALRNPAGPPLYVDLHRRLSRTTRSRLTTAGMFQRGRPDTKLFGAPVTIPCGEDLFGHLLLHATLHWINNGQLHRPQDFVAIGDTLSLDPNRCAEHLRQQGLEVHALVLLPSIALQVDAHFCREVLAALSAPTRVPTLARAKARLVDLLCVVSTRGHVVRRLAGLALAPSLAEAIVSAARDRLDRPASG